MCLWNTDAPGGNKVKYGKIYKSHILTPPHPQGHVISVRCEQPLDELTVQVWLLYHHPNFNYCTFYISGTELRTDGQTDKQTDRWTIRLLDAPADLSGRGHKNENATNNLLKRQNNWRSTKRPNYYHSTKQLNYWQSTKRQSNWLLTKQRSNWLSTIRQCKATDDLQRSNDNLQNYKIDFLHIDKATGNQQNDKELKI